VALAAERATAEARHEKEMNDLAARMRSFYEERRTMEGQKEFLTEYARKIGYHEPISSIPVGSSGLTMSVFPNDGPEEEALDAIEELRPRKNSEERFGQTSLTKAEEPRPAPARSSSVFHPRKHRTA
jgi:hypothetical protein